MKNSPFRLGKHNEHKVHLTSPWDDAVEGINFCLERIYELYVLADDELVPGIKNDELTSSLIQARNTIAAFVLAVKDFSIGDLETIDELKPLASKLERSLRDK